MHDNKKSTSENMSKEIKRWKNVLTTKRNNSKGTL